MATYDLQTLLGLWAQGELTLKQAVGHIFQQLLLIDQRLKQLDQRLRQLEGRLKQLEGRK